MFGTRRGCRGPFFSWSIISFLNKDPFNGLYTCTAWEFRLEVYKSIYANTSGVSFVICSFVNRSFGKQVYMHWQHYNKRANIDISCIICML